jgi:uncharacterized CHY-type Zn-finger protein
VPSAISEKSLKAFRAGKGIWNIYKIFWLINKGYFAIWKCRDTLNVLFVKNVSISALGAVKLIWTSCAKWNFTSVAYHPIKEIPCCAMRTVPANRSFRGKSNWLIL